MIETVVKLRAGTLRQGRMYAIRGERETCKPAVFLGRYERATTCWNNGEDCVMVKRLAFATPYYTLVDPQGVPLPPQTRTEVEWKPLELTTGAKVWGDWSAWFALHEADEYRLRLEHHHEEQALRERLRKALRMLGLPERVSHYDRDSQGREQLTAEDRTTVRRQYVRSARGYRYGEIEEVSVRLTGSEVLMLAGVLDSARVRT